MTMGEVLAMTEERGARQKLSNLNFDIACG
jgi:hypothetical protein